MVRIPTDRTPTHPGEVLLEEFLRPSELTQRELAGAIEVPYQRVNEIVRGRRGNHPEHRASTRQVLRDHPCLLDEPSAQVGPLPRAAIRGTAARPDCPVGGVERSRRRVAGASLSPGPRPRFRRKLSPSTLRTPAPLRPRPRCTAVRSRSCDRAAHRSAPPDTARAVSSTRSRRARP